MTLAEAKKIIKSECYIADLLDLDRTQTVNIALDTVLTAAEETRWIPVTERLPEHDTPRTVEEAYTGIKYLVTLTTGKVAIAKWQFYIEGGNQSGLLGFWAWGRQYGQMITAWRPLPHPYKAEGSDSE